MWLRSPGARIPCKFTCCPGNTGHTHDISGVEVLASHAAEPPHYRESHPVEAPPEVLHPEGDLPLVAAPSQDHPGDQRSVAALEVGVRKDRVAAETAEEHRDL